ncbi:hypothetical protein [Kiloniella sp.]|uniref:hypothetical protein n=1 Tax=Kiloniella sp. TaxID=1938587 RepID=UPI003B015A29
MTDNVTNELILEHLKSIQTKLTSVDNRLGNLETDVRAIKGHMVSFMQTELAQDSTIAEIQTRLARIEKRLDLVDNSA